MIRKKFAYKRREECFHQHQPNNYQMIFHSPQKIEPMVLAKKKDKKLNCKLFLITNYRTNPTDKSTS